MKENLVEYIGPIAEPRDLLTVGAADEVIVHLTERGKTIGTFQKTVGGRLVKTFNKTYKHFTRETSIKGVMKGGTFVPAEIVSGSSAILYRTLRSKILKKPGNEFEFLYRPLQESEAVDIMKKFVPKEVAPFTGRLRWK